MPLDPPDWGAREARMLREPAPPKPDDPDEMSKLAPRLFRTRDGRVWLDRMSHRLFAHAIGMEPSEAMLRYLEAQRDMLREIVRHIDAAERAEKAQQK
jgi:hypothetical protein